MKNWWPISWMLVAAICCLPFVLIGGLFAWDKVDDWRHRRAFDSATWKRKDPDPSDPHWPPRLCMVDDLLDSHRLDGMAEEGVVGLLGPPEDRMDLPETQEYSLSYYLGPERGTFGIDSESLLL